MDNTNKSMEQHNGDSSQDLCEQLTNKTNISADEIEIGEPIDESESSQPGYIPKEKRKCNNKI